MGALDGLKVADFTQAMSGPICAQLFGDFGAEVIKLEPLAGDGARKWGSARWGANDEFSSEYLALNRNKQSIAVDLKNPEGLEMARCIVAQADILLENYKPGVIARLGLGYEEMAKINPRLIFCSISGFGQTGPLSARPGYDQLMQAYAGLLSITGDPGRTSVRIGPSAIDVLTGSYAMNGILVALLERERSGLGQLVDASLYESAFQTVTHYLVDATGTGKPMGKSGPYFQFLAPYGVFMASDREFYIGVGTQAMWTRLTTAIERQDLASDPRFATNRARTENMAALYDILVPLFKNKPAAFWTSLADSLQIPNSLIHDLNEVVVQEQAIAREAVVPIEGYPTLRSAGIPVKLSRTPGSIRRPPPSLGADADDVLSRYGFSVEEVSGLRKGGAIR
jgi:crotonobetainyl-CoA:carnitine CoA-transferase CaiB-like acyl-CoA transferase